MEAFLPSIALTPSAQLAISISLSARPSHNTLAKRSVSPRAHAWPHAVPSRTASSGVPEALGGKGETTVIWFRDDLRVDDHAVLAEAAGRDCAIGAVVLQRERSPDAFWASCVTDLRESLRARGGELFIRPAWRADSLPEALVSFCREAGARRLNFHRAVTADGVAEERAVCKAVEALGVRCSGFWTGMLRTPDELPFSMDDMPEDCDEFGTRVCRVGVREPQDAPREVRTVRMVGVGEAGEVAGVVGTALGGEGAGLRRVAEYVSGGLVAVREGASAGAIDTKFGRLGPFLTAGCVSPRRFWFEVRTRVADRSLRLFCAEFELVLRDFVRMMTLKRGMLPA